MVTPELLQKLCRQHDLCQRQGYADTGLDEVKLFRISKHEEVMPMLYNRGIIFIGTGRKTGTIGSKQFNNGPEHYLIVTSPQLIQCECFVSNGQLVGIFIQLNMSRLHRMVSKLQQLDMATTPTKPMPFSVLASEKSTAIEDAHQRLLKALLDPVEIEMLGDSLLDELYFRILQDEHGYALHQLCEQGSAFSRVSKVIELIHNRLDEKISVEEMAQKAGMSITAFHRAFKEAFNDTPIQYTKKIRLNKARQYIVHEKVRAVTAAERVGYESQTQFSREFKRYFGVSPSQATKLGYAAF